jgi:hypothetical protein
VVPPGPSSALGYRTNQKHFFIAPATTLQPMDPLPAFLSVKPWRLTTSLSVNAPSAPLNGDPGVVGLVPYRASGNVFDSGWFLMGSQNAAMSYRQGVHGLNVEPELAQLSVCP